MLGEVAGGMGGVVWEVMGVVEVAVVGEVAGGMGDVVLLGMGVVEVGEVGELAGGMGDVVWVGLYWVVLQQMCVILLQSISTQNFGFLWLLEVDDVGGLVILMEGVVE